MTCLPQVCPSSVRRQTLGICPPWVMFVVLVVVMVQGVRAPGQQSDQRNKEVRLHDCGRQTQLLRKGQGRARKPDLPKTRKQQCKGMNANDQLLGLQGCEETASHIGVHRTGLSHAFSGSIPKLYDYGIIPGLDPSQSLDTMKWESPSTVRTQE